MRYSTVILTGMATYAYAQDADLASLNSQLASLGTELGPSIASAVTDNVGDLSSLSDLGPSIQSVASAAIASATANGNLDDLQSAASEAESSLRQIWSTLDPGARSSVSSALSELGLDYASITSAAGSPRLLPHLLLTTVMLKRRVALRPAALKTLARLPILLQPPIRTAWPQLLHSPWWLLVQVSP